MTPNHCSDRLVCVIGAALLAFGCAQSSSGGAPVTTAASPPVSQAALDRSALSDFTKRVDRYKKLHDKLERKGTRQRTRDDVGENIVSENALATRIRFARHDARPGDIFTPAIAATLRVAMDAALRGAATMSTRESIGEDAPSTFVLVVNGDYPEGASRSTMPGRVLTILPSLPDDLEYRIVAPHLVLMDTEANIVVDYILDVM